MHERVVPFKVEMGTLIENLGKANASEVSTLAKAVKDAEATIKQQDRVVTTLCDKYEAVSSQLQMLEAGGRQSTEEQRSLLQKARDNVRAEALVVLNERLKEEVGAFEEKIEKRFEEVDKKTKGIERKIEASKNDQEEQKAQHVTLTAKLEDIGKLVAELTMSSHKESKEDLSKFCLNRCRQTRIGKYL